jgi:hypothetical protein
MMLDLAFARRVLVGVAFASFTVALGACGGSVAPSSGEEGDSGTSSDTGGGGSDGGTSTDSGSGTDGGLPGECGGMAGIACPSGMWCEFPIGTCHEPDARGTCRKREALPCPPPAPTDRVCGCDGVTYNSACEAISSGMSELHAGACDGPPPLSCGGSGGVTCPSGDYCDFGDGTCPAPGSSGTCTPEPSGCPDIYAPVCGCDGVTYGNGCDAHAHGVTIASTGACASPGGATCGGFAGATCASDQYCDWGKIPSFCGGDDATGTCKPRPTYCEPVDGVYCGCDGKTYESPCAAGMAGTGVRDVGPCK